MNQLADRHGRAVRYLRVSLTPDCNYRCVFCVPDRDGAAGTEARLTTEEMLRLCRVFARLGVDRFKITGGEPFLHPDALAFMAGLKADAAAPVVSVTTNGSTLDRHAAALAALGIDGINVSINALTQAGYERVTGTRFRLDRILDAVERAREAGLRVKLNMVPMRGVNENDIVPLLEFALARDIPVRFIELMPIGEGKRYTGLNAGEVQAIITARFGATEPVRERMGNGPAAYLSLPGRAGRIGFIAPLSRRFCAACDRVRLNSAGFLRTCLHHGHGADLSPLLRRGADDAAVAERIREIVAAKPQGHDFAGNGGAAHDEPMLRIGG